MQKSERHSSPSPSDVQIDPELLLSSHMQLPQTKASNVVDYIIRCVGGCLSWVWVVLLAVIITNVVLRYVFHSGHIELEELQWHLYSLGFLIGFSYCAEADEHVRVDILRVGLAPRTQCWIELLGILFFLVPFIIFILIHAVPFVFYSWEIGETSDAPSGLPYRWIVKSFLIVGFVLLALSMLSRFTRVTAFLFGIPSAIPGVGKTLNQHKDKAEE